MAASKQIARPIAWASSVEWRKNQLLSAAQYDNCLPKNRADFDMPLYGQAAIDAAVAAERKRCAKICEIIGSKMTESCIGAYQGSWPDQVGYACAKAILAPTKD